MYTDVDYVTRLLSRLYSPHHYYLFHLDAASPSKAFESELRALLETETFGSPAVRVSGNVHLARDVQIVYGASTATIVLTKAMAWFDRSVCVGVRVSVCACVCVRVAVAHAT